MEIPALLPNHPYAAFLDQVEKPARYAGGEVGSRVKNWNDVEATVCLAFPDVYDIGMSHLGFKILYRILNDDPRTLAERVYAPWADMEAELTKRNVPLVSIESARPLRDFSVVGFSLQYELTYTNILTMLHFGRIPLRSADRGENDPLVIAGGPTATHPEPLAAFFDAFVIGDGEEKCSEVALTWERLKKQGISRRDRLIALAKLGAVYIPSLYETAVNPDTGLTVVTKPLVPGLPSRIERSMVDINKYPFPDDSPAGGPEAIFDRMSIEIARGCTEGCRFCQAGMIYRPVRERDPEQVVETVLRAVKNSGQDEVSLTALSTADVSCISPLIKKVSQRLAEERISLGVSSLRAYGLEPELLDEIKRVRATGLTFAPEAGTQRMRDVVNKNVTEEQLLETAERVFSRGWGKMKLYFMIGLPTETDDDVKGIIEAGARTAAVGKKAAKGRAEVTVSVSVHVPKPHTPFQWAAMDTLSEVSRKQKLLLETVRPHRAVTLRTHDADASLLECIFARGDRTLCDVLERAWKNGARFDSWDERLKLDVWEEAFVHFGIEREKFINTLPITAKLPWDHIDVGLEDGFLAREYRKALQSRLSPPCGKVAGTFVHHTNVEDAEADKRRLVCYDCGVACDMTQMRTERITFLGALGAKKRLPLIENAPTIQPIVDPLPPSDEPNDISLTIESSPIETEVPASAQKKRVPAPPRSARGKRYRFVFEKIGPMALLGHLDIVRELPRVLRRCETPAVYTQGFHPKPDMTFSPALSLGVLSVAEAVDLRINADYSREDLLALIEKMNKNAPAGFIFYDAAQLSETDLGIAKMITGARYALVWAKSALRDAGAGADVYAWLTQKCNELLAAPSFSIRRNIDGVGKIIDLKKYLRSASVAPELANQPNKLGGLAGDLAVVIVDVDITGGGSVKASEVAHALVGDIGHRAVRIALLAGEVTNVLDLANIKKPVRIEAPVAQPSADGHASPSIEAAQPAAT
ncbi:MAG: TIGR03960 family B12-binding radical SAM protein [Polyangiaceae bacterium]|nr:TIGR03960 family B12-binding radical SAM protein [Polyangiaceae bacterium]